MTSSSMEVGWALEGTPPAEELLAAHGFWGEEIHIKGVALGLFLCPSGLPYAHMGSINLIK